MKRDFNEWLTTFRRSIANYGYYVDFAKVHANIEEIKIPLNILNSLIGSKHIEKDFEKLVAAYPETLKCIPLLLAVRANEICAMDADGEFQYSFTKPNQSAEQYKVFMRKTGLFDLLENHIDLSAISNQGKMEKRFDYVVKTDSMIYVIETNFYTGGGSKLNETARSYKTLAGEVDTINGVTFVWFTDGIGWKSARHNLEETFDVMDNIYNIEDMENDIISKVFI